MEGMARVLLLDTQSEGLLSTHRSELLPFLLGLLRERQHVAEWWVVHVPLDALHAGGRFVVDLPTDQAAPVLEALAAWSPDVVVLSDRLVPALRDALQRRAPGARLVEVPEFGSLEITRADALRWLETGAWAPRDEGGVDALVARVAPCYERRRFPAGGTPDEDLAPVRLLTSRSCSYHRPLSANRFFRELGPVAQAHRGCSFCPRSRHHAARPGLDVVELVLAQVIAHQRAEPERGLPLEYLVEDADLFQRLDAFVERAAALRLRPSRFTVMVRADDLLRARARLERVLPRMVTAGLGLDLVSIGAENFSPSENERFNKGVTPEKLFACHALIADLQRRFAGTFSVPGSGVFAAILWTPWSTPDDLLANIAAADVLGLAWLTGAVGMRLQLFADVPITDLARHDGLTVDRFDDLGCVAANCITSADRGEQPWRFADARTAAIFRLLVRLDPIHPSVSLAPDDPLLLRLRELRRGLPEAAGFSYLALARGLVRGVVALGPEATPEALVRHAFADWLATAPPGSPAADYRDVLAAVARIRAWFAERPAGLGGWHLAAHEMHPRSGHTRASVVLGDGHRRLAFEIAAVGAEGDGWQIDGPCQLRAIGDGGTTRASHQLGLALLRLAASAHLNPRRQTASSSNPK